MAIIMYCILLAFIQSGCHAFEYRVGGKSGWAVPNDTYTESYNQWAGRNRFKVGDSLVFLYNPSEDSVLQVTNGDYLSCSTSQPIASFKDENTVFTLPKPGPFFFISGASGHCQKGQKLHVIVLSIRGAAPPASPLLSPHVVPYPSPSPSPSPISVPVPAPAPAPAALYMMETPAPSPSPVAAAPTSTAVPAVLPLKSAGFMCALLLSGCVFIL